MTTDIVLDDNEVRIEGDDPEPLLALRAGQRHTVVTPGSVRLTGAGTASVTISDDRGKVNLSGFGVRAATVRATESVAAQAATINSLEASTVTVGFGPTGEGATGAPGRIEVLDGSGRAVVTIDGESGDIEIAGFGNVTQMFARLQGQVSALQARLG